MGSFNSNLRMYSRVESDDKGEVKSVDDMPKEKASVFDLAIVSKPYFWPSTGSDSAIVNRCRSSLTWVMVSLSKTCSLVAPIYLSRSTNSLANGHIYQTGINILLYCCFRFASSFFKEMQSVVYLKVKQQANIQLAELAFTHIHSLSLNWHLSKKMGNVIRSMDRGTSAADTLITYLFLYLLPALAECIAVCFVFLFKFSEWKLSITALGGVVLYATVTILITMWRKKFREATNRHDNDYHDKATDSIVNYETVKYFNGESYEINRFKSMVSAYQKFNLKTVSTMNLLNVIQQLIISVTMCGAMLISARSVLRGRMTIGDFIAVNAYTMGMFAPLSFLGSIYNAIIQALVDVKHLLNLLTEEPDVLDIPGAIDIPVYTGPCTYPFQDTQTATKRSVALQCATCHKALYKEWVCCPYCGQEIYSGLELTDTHSELNVLHVKSVVPYTSKGVPVEFSDVFFHYPAQPIDKGLKNVSFYVAPGTTTAIVGHSGSGKTTISRLLFRFYDPQRGCVKIGGYDIRQYTQKSIRGCLGIVPQDTVLFNDTILHNVRYGNMNATMDQIDAAAEAAQIKQFIINLPDKWETQVV